ncbi:hypothetical protein PTSG_10548 [Salpingoeca rosetta]|uniref:Protein tyrosine phosphatase n=1 Tax=Salpingoeca rosetta (strain ATCC 50818 / BSB-021) TaxID=946362 RepID=F2URN7_SALR5|nr:uncharacterized protein PTSG_10548 [Salpingoeca rosetta]EGD80292.1 hypothetical protein PTSG_10548 [Salpingoeca rosetta]|eukprot:XP_004988082.1 hypothetical protein PTSG_10548 [Salpingoeca rosetta]
MDATSSPSPTSLTSPTSTAAAAAAAATTTAALSSSSPRKWLGPRVVRVERGEGGRFNFDVSGGAESLMLPRVILHHAGAAPNYVTHERLNTGDEIVAVDNIQVAGMSHDAVVRVLKAAKETVTLTVLPIDQRTAFQCNDNAQQEGTGKIFKAQSSSAFRTLDSDVPITTRPPLSDEVDGKDYHFVSVALFQYLLTHKHVREWGQLKSHFYGALKTTLEVSPVRSLSNVDLIATTIKSRCGRLKVAHVQRNANGVFGFTIGGGAGVGELPFVDRVCDVKIANPDKASILPNDAILAIDGVTVAAETSGAVTELITAGGNIVKLLLLTHSFDGVRERGASGDDRSTTNSFRAHAPPAMSNTYAASASSSSATSSATTGITSSSAAAAAMMARGQRVQATSSSSSSSIAATSATTTPAASAAADADAQNQNAHSAGGVLNAFAPPGVGDFGVKQVAAEMEGTLRKASGEAVGGGDGGERVKGDGVKGELVLTNGDIKTAEMMALEQHSGKEEGKKEEDTKTEEVEEDTETGTSATAAETSAPTADDGGDGDVSKARDVKNGMGDGQDEAADTTQKTENTMGQNMSEPSTAPTAAANAEEAEKEEDATGDGDGDGDGGAQWNSDVVSVDPFAAVDDTDTKASATTTTTTVAGGGKQDIVRDESPVTKRSRTTTAASSGGDDDDDDDDGEYVQIIAGDEDDDDDDNTKKEEEEAEKRVPVNIEPAMHASIMKLSKDHALADEFVALSRVGVSSTSEHSAKNRSKNRYRNITAYDHTRVVLDILEGDDDCDYYNANFIPSDSSAQSYIACQGPTPPSMEDFWRMVWQKDVSVIVMVTKETELGRIKCHRYWPTLAATEAGRPLEMGYYTVKCTAENVTFLLTDRTFELERYGEPIRTVRQVHYHSWPDHGIPQHLSDLLLFREYVRGVHASMGHRGPLLVHCSAGVGRSGTFIAIDRIMRRLEVMPRHEPVTKETVDLNKIVHEMRTCRNLMVQTTEQYIFLHKLITHLLAQCREVDALDVSSHLQSQFEQRQLEFENAYDSLESYSDDSDDDGK